MKLKFVLMNLSLAPILISCASAPKTEPKTVQAPSKVQTSGGSSLNVDIEGLKRSLGLDRSRGDLGYQEKYFNTCSAGFGYPRENCSEQVFVSIHFRLQCRDTTGTTSEVVTSAQMDPIANKKVLWQIGRMRAPTHTDAEGYGKIDGVLSKFPAPKGQRLRLAVGDQFVYVRAGEITRIVTPSNWCN